ncbi:MAG: family 78 glycoside hydrolase catalytic domain [Phycisphaerae bacterium]|nr:family 78 glycoside hydrolase catalytic domain [Phycisphaerae bacterium]
MAERRVRDAGDKTQTAFSSSARWIWAREEHGDAWWMFRREFTLPKDFHDGRLRITAAFHYSLYINGQRVARGPARSYDFCKIFDTVDVRAFLRPGQKNVVCILAPSHRKTTRRGVLAELSWTGKHGKRRHLCTDSRWKCRRHAAFKDATAGRLIGVEILLGREEWFDARKEIPGWNSVRFDDSSWEEAEELGPANTPPWNRLEDSGIRRLTDKPIGPKAFTAIELAQLRPGYRIRLTSPEEYIDTTKVFMTELTCAAPVNIRFHCNSKVYLNGRPVDHDSGKRNIPFAEGTHLLSIYQAGYYQHELEFLLETESELSFSAHHLLKEQPAPWALAAFPGATIAYPWHETPAGIPEPSELRRLLETTRAEEIPDDLRRNMAPLTAHEGSVSLDVKTQVYPTPDGTAQPASPVSPSRHWVRDDSEAATIHPTTGYDAHCIADFDREMIGYVELTVDAPAGTVIDVQCFEKFEPDGIAWMKHNGFRYVCREGLQTFTSHYRRGFRYASVTLRNFDMPVRFHSLQCRQETYPVRQVGPFECDDEPLNRAYRMSVDTAAVCMLDTYVDCPGHEQAFWVGDARITALINLLAFGAYELDQRCIRLVGQSLSPEWVREYRPDDERYTNGRYLPIAAFPDYPEGGLPMWSFLWGLQCWDHWLHGGNADDLKENYGYLKEMLRHCRLLTNERGLFDMPGAWNLIEWAANDLSPYGEVTASNVLLIQCLRHAAAMAEALHLPEEQRDHTAEAEKRLSAVNRLCWDEQRRAYVDTVRDEWAHERYRELCRRKGWDTLSWEQYRSCLRVSEQTNTLAVVCGCVPPERLESVKAIVMRVKAGRFLQSKPANRGIGVPSEEEAPDGVVAIGSPFFLFFSLGALFRLEEGDTAVELMRREWGKMAAMGFRTCPESFGRARSAAHAWSAAPAVYLPQYVLGVRPLEAGYRRFVVDPRVEKLQWARGSVATPYGPIHVDWRRDGKNEIRITCTCPSECRRV